MIDQLGNKISMALSKDILWVHKNQCRAFADNKFYSFKTNDIEIEQSPEEDTSDPVYSQTATLLVTMSEAERQLFHNQNVIIILTTLRGKEIIWGTKQYPVRCIALPNLDSVSLNLSCKTPEPLRY